MRSQFSQALGPDWPQTSGEQCRARLAMRFAIVNRPGVAGAVLQSPL